MRILYVARHGQTNSNDDEGAIAYALERLGHEVVKVQEFGDSVPIDSPFVTDQGRLDLCLFHKWANVEFLRRIKIPKAFWYFDLVDWPSDLTLSSRCEARKRWMAEVTPLVDLGFLSDGDWVERWNGGRTWENRREMKPGDDRGKLRVLRQGADERIAGFGKEAPRDLDVLFVGGVKGCGTQREGFVQRLRERYGNRFHWIDKGCYREGLRDVVARSKVVVCPDSPVTDRYWSNRLYVMAGFGACILHPMCWDLNSPMEFVNGTMGYSSRDDLFQKIDELLKDDPKRARMSELALDHAKHRHLYRHRCKELVRVVKEQLHI